MKKTLILAIAAVAILASCQGSGGDKTTTTSAQEIAAQKGDTLTVNKELSSLMWKAYHKGGFDPRFGTLQTSGTVSIENEAITGGTFIIDVNSLLTDVSAVDPAKSGGKTAADLDSHLKSEDFFESTKYPTASFTITNVAPYDSTTASSVVPGANSIISGNLTIKDKTVNVTFPAKVTITAAGVDVMSQFTINRQDWGLTYGTEGSPKDWVIAQEVDISLNFQASK